MYKQSETFLIRIYKGEGRILIIPIIDSKNSNWYARIENMEDCASIGQGVLDAIEVIKNKIYVEAPFKAGDNGYAIEKNSKHNSWVSFWKHNHYTGIKIYEDEYYEIFSLTKSEVVKGIYKDLIKKIVLPNESTAEEIGKAIIDVFRATEEYYRDRTVPDVRYKVIELLNKSKLTITPLKNSHFTDNGDSGAAEIYQCYSYTTNENAEPTAEFFLGIAPELDCNLESNNVRTSWEDFYGEADYFEMNEVEHGIFKYRVEMRNKDSHKISYILRQEEDLLLECGMEVHSPNRRKKTDEKLEKMFEEFVLSCKL